jgi:hypothetical protein
VSIEIAEYEEKFVGRIVRANLTAYFDNALTYRLQLL